MKPLTDAQRYEMTLEAIRDKRPGLYDTAPLLRAGFIYYIRAREYPRHRGCSIVLTDSGHAALQEARG